MHITICQHHKMCVYMSAKLSQIYMDLLTPLRFTYKTEKLKVMTTLTGFGLQHCWFQSFHVRCLRHGA